MFRTLWASVEGRKKDITENGALSCAYFVSAVLAVAQSGFSVPLLRTVHATVNGTLRDMESCGWRRIARPRKGAVVVWEARDGHRHIGFVAGRGAAVSNDTARGVIARHALTFGGKGTPAYRRVEAYWWHDAFTATSPKRKKGCR